MLSVFPGFADALSNLGLLLHAAGRLDEAESAYRRALELNTRPATQVNLGMLLISQGRYAEGWPLYESRFSAGLKNPPSFAFPKWAGESLAGKSLLLWPEQGFGDYVQFVRYAPLLKRLGLSRLTLVCAPPLAELMRSVDGADAVLTASDAIVPHDYWLPIMSAPHRLGTTLATIPVALPYIQPDAGHVARWSARTPGGAFKVGLVWRGSPANNRDASRSLPGLRALTPLWDVPGVEFFSLMRNGDEDEPGQPMKHLGPDIEDFADAAAAISCLDLLICVDTAYAHLSGAMGRRCWVLLQAGGTEWRWLHGRDDSPWYPGAVRLFRQREAGIWDGTIADVARELRELATPQSRP